MFEYHQPESLEAASGLLRAHGDDSVLVAGGTELLLLMKLGFSSPGHLINLKKIEGLSRVEEIPGGIRIGALVTHESIADSTLVRTRLPAFARSESLLANPRVRNAGTLAGNIAFAEPRSDPATALVALNADVETFASGADGRELLLQDFLLGSYQTALRPGEILTAIKIPTPPRMQLGFRRVTLGAKRPLLVVAATLCVNGTARLRVVVGALTECPHVTEVESPTIDDLADRAAELPGYIGSSVPLSYAGGRGGPNEDYSRHLVDVTLSRLLRDDLGLGVEER
jgi:carbon-monoxide dehydrogenase medium subunit